MKNAVIFGANSGLAKVVIERLVKMDYECFCCDIAYEHIFKEGNITYIPVDVTDNESIVRAYDYIIQQTDKVDVLSNFAGIVTLGSMVELPLNSLDRIIQINLLSTYKINSLFFKLVNNASGRIVNISSEYGKICGIPFHGYYGISKHGIEIYNDSLRRELAGSNVKVIGIRPGAFKTNMQAGIMNQFEKMVNETDMYKAPLNKMKHIMTKELDKAKDPNIFAEAFIKAITVKKPKYYYNVKNSLKMKLLTMLPKKLQDYSFKIYLK